MKYIIQKLFYYCRGQAIVSKRMFLPWFQVEAIWRFTSYSKELRKYRIFAKRLITGVSKCECSF